MTNNFIVEMHLVDGTLTRTFQTSIDAGDVPDALSRGDVTRLFARPSTRADVEAAMSGAATPRVGPGTVVVVLPGIPPTFVWITGVSSIAHRSDGTVIEFYNSKGQIIGSFVEANILGFDVFPHGWTQVGGF